MQFVAGLLSTLLMFAVLNVWNIATGGLLYPIRRELRLLRRS